jgi:hypothetical protein
MQSRLWETSSRQHRTGRTRRSESSAALQESQRDTMR